MSKWSQYYENRLGNGYADYAASRYQPMIKLLLSLDQGTMREEGCGIGTISRILLTLNPNINLTICDNDTDILKLAKINLHNLKVKDIQKCNIAAKPSILTDTIFSHGVLEHFSDIGIKRVLTRQKQYSANIVHYVPTDGYSTPSFGDERLMSIDWWLNTWNPKSYELFNDNKDLILIW